MPIEMYPFLTQIEFHYVRVIYQHVVSFLYFRIKIFDNCMSCGIVSS